METISRQLLRRFDNFIRSLNIFVICFRIPLNSIDKKHDNHFDMNLSCFFILEEDIL